MADDDESLDEILSGPTTEPEKTTEDQPSTEPVRDEHGRFAPKADDAEPEAPPSDPTGHEPEGTAPNKGFVPHSRFNEVNESAKAERARADRLEAMLNEALRQRQPAQPQPKPVKPPEIWDDPNAFVQHALSPLQQEIIESRYQTSRVGALFEFGKDVVTAAEAAMEQAVTAGTINPQTLRGQLMKSRDPVGDVVRWHQSSPAVQEASLREKLEAEILAKYGIDPSAPPSTPSPTPSNRNPNVRLPPSLTRIPAGHSAPERDESLDEVLSASRRRA